MFSVNKSIYCPLIERDLCKVLNKQPLINAALARIGGLYKSASNGNVSSRVTLFGLLLDIDDFLKKYKDEYNLQLEFIEKSDFILKSKSSIPLSFNDPISMKLLDLIDYVDTYYIYRQQLFMKGKKLKKNNLITLSREVLTVFKRAVYFSDEVINENMLKASYTYPLMPSKKEKLWKY